jgi:hypothetical protein
MRERGRCAACYDISMSAKKEKADWYIAGVHMITAGFAIPIIFGLAYIFVVVPFLGIDIETPLGFVIGETIGLAIIYLGVWYSAEYIKRTYIFPNPMRIVNLSTLYLGVLMALSATADIFVPAEGLEDTFYIVGNVVTSAAVLAVFYFSSRRKLR